MPLTQRVGLFLGACLALTVTGCAASEAASENDAALLQRLRGELVVDPPIETVPASEADVPENAGPNDYVRLALERNPRLLAAVARARRQAARVPQAGSLDDPMLTITPIGAMAQTAAGEVQTMLGVSQRLPLPQKLDARADAARQETTAAVAELEHVRQTLAAETRMAFWDYWLADRQIAVTRQSRNLLANLREAATAQLRAGRAGQADVLRAATELASLDNELIDLEQDRDVAIAALNRLLDREPDAPLPAPPDVLPTPRDAQLDALLAEAAANPRLAARAADIEAARQRLRLARLDYWPDLTVIGNYSFVDDEGLSAMANGDDQWSLGFGINVPLWQGKRRAAEREQRAAILEGIARLGAEQNDIAYEVRQAVAEVDAGRRLVELLSEEVIPQARQTVEATAAAYRAGDADFLSYVDAWRRLLEFELTRQRATADLGRATADLDLALGRTPTGPEVQP